MCIKKSRKQFLLISPFVLHAGLVRGKRFTPFSCVSICATKTAFILHRASFTLPSTDIPNALPCRTGLASGTVLRTCALFASLLSSDSDSDSDSDSAVAVGRHVKGRSMLPKETPSTLAQLYHSPLRLFPCREEVKVNDQRSVVSGRSCHISRPPLSSPPSLTECGRVGVASHRSCRPPHAPSKVPHASELGNVLRGAFSASLVGTFCRSWPLRLGMRS